MKQIDIGNELAALDISGLQAFFLIYLNRYQAELNEDSSLGKAEPLTVGGVLCPPSQATPRTSKNVSILTIAIGNSLFCCSCVYFIRMLVLLKIV